MDLEAMAVAWDQNVDTLRAESFGERPVRGDNPGPMTHRRVEHRGIALAGDRKDGKPPGESQGGSRVGHAPSDEALQFIDHGGGNHNVRARAEPVDLGLHREPGPSEEEQCIRVQEDRTFRF